MNQLEGEISHKHFTFDVSNVAKNVPEYQARLHPARTLLFNSEHDQGLKQLVADNLILNQDLRNRCEKLGFFLHTTPNEGVVRVCLSL